MARWDIDFQLYKPGAGLDEWIAIGDGADTQGNLQVVAAPDCPEPGIDRGMSVDGLAVWRAYAWTRPGIIEGFAELLTLTRADSDAAAVPVGGLAVLETDASGAPRPQSANGELGPPGGANNYLTLRVRDGLGAGGSTTVDLAAAWLLAAGDYVWTRTRIDPDTGTLYVKSWKWGTNEPVDWSATYPQLALLSEGVKGYPGLPGSNTPGGTLMFMSVSTDPADPPRRIPPLSLRTLTTQILVQEL